jgi:ribonuclease P protein component
MTQKFTLPASKRLKSQKQIAQLFATGQSHFIYPFKLLFLKEHMETQGESNVQFAVSVPKKRLKPPSKGTS